MSFGDLKFLCVLIRTHFRTQPTILHMSDTINIDGSRGEGGGQIVRSSLALSLVTGKPLTLSKIRARRSRPGLMRQHLTAVQAAAQIGAAEVTGDSIGSREVTFRPATLNSGEYRFSVGTAGSTMLVLQTVLPALITADGDSRVIVEGGTHNPFAPPFDFLERVYAPLIARMGARINMTLERPGFYPAGGGRAVITIKPAGTLKPLKLPDRGKLVRKKVRALVCNLPRHIGQRECRRVTTRCDWSSKETVVEEVKIAAGPGNVVLVELESEHVTELFSAFGEKGRPAEAVADQCVRQVKRYLKADVPVGEYLADQIILPLAIGASQSTGGGTFRTLKLSEHSMTHIEVVKSFLDIEIDIRETDRDSCSITIQPDGTQSAPDHS